MKQVVFILILCSSPFHWAQEVNATNPMTIPVRNSLTFNKFLINPTFSFVREQYKYVSFYNKREFTEFSDAPNTYLASFSGRFSEQIGAGIGLYQQSYGVISSIGGTANFAYNINLSRVNNLTFGLNTNVLNTSLNTNAIITNFEDPALQNVPNNTAVSVSPAINFGSTFLDIGLVANNIINYNISDSSLSEDNAFQSFQAHLMYNGYMDARGFFDESKFTGLLTTEFVEDETIFAGMAMITVPKGIWAQVGYNSRFGLTGGLGLNITKAIAVEYTYERGFGDLIDFGASHHIVLAYRIAKRKRYFTGPDDEAVGLIETRKRPKRRYASKLKTTRNSTTAIADAQVEKDNTTSIAKRNEEAKVKAEEAAKLKAAREAEALAKKEAQKQAQEEARLKAEAAQQAKKEAELKAKAEELRLAEEQKAREQAEAARLKALAEKKAQEEAKAARLKVLAEKRAQEEAEAARLKILAEKKAQEEAAKRQALAEQKAEEEAARRQALAAQLAAEKEARLKAEQEQEKAEAQRLAEEAAQQKEEELKQIKEPKDASSQKLLRLANKADSSSVEQAELLTNLDAIVDRKEQTLRDLKEENDLSEQGITVAPKPFRSTVEENNRLERIQNQLDQIITERTQEIEDLERAYADIIGDTITNDVVLLYYKNKIKRLKSEQAQAITTRNTLEAELETIKVATAYEKSRRIRRANFTNNEDRYQQDRKTLERIINTTAVDNKPIKVEDLDFGYSEPGKIQIKKNINHVDEGFYLVLAVHDDVEKRDEFIKKVVASGQKEINFFYDLNSSKYYIYCDKATTINNINKIAESKDEISYYNKNFIVKIEN